MMYVFIHTIIFYPKIYHNLNTSFWFTGSLSESKQVTKSIANVPLFSIIILSIVCVFGLFIVGYDQGHIFSVVQGEQAYVDQFIHELTHDIRHAAGFPCH